MAAMAPCCVLIAERDPTWLVTAVLLDVHSASYQL